jgi:hypothetical protein
MGATSTRDRSVRWFVPNLCNFCINLGRRNLGEANRPEECRSLGNLRTATVVLQFQVLLGIWEMVRPWSGIRRVRSGLGDFVGIGAPAERGTQGAQAIQPERGFLL